MRSTGFRTSRIDSSAWRIAAMAAVLLTLLAAPLALAPPAGAAAAGTDIGNAAPLSGSTSGSLASGSSDDWWVIYPATLGETVQLTAHNTTSKATICNSVDVTLDATNGSGDSVGGAVIGPSTSAKVSGSQTVSDRYFVEVTISGGCNPPVGQPVTYTLTLDAGGGGSAPSPAGGSIHAGSSIGTAWPPLQGETSYTGTVTAGNFDGWYALYKSPDTNPATIRVENTTVSGSTTCNSIDVTLDAANASGNSVGGAVLSDNSASTLPVPGKSATDPTGLYYLEIRSSGGCPAGGATYRIEPEPATEWANPAKLEMGTATAGSSIGAACPPMQGGTTYDRSIANGILEFWYVLYNLADAVPATVRVENTTVSGSTTCDSIDVTLDSADGSGNSVGGAVLSDNSASTIPIPTPLTPDYLGRYYLEITNSGGCPAGGATYRIEPEPGSEWLNPAKPSTASLPSGATKDSAGGPLNGGGDLRHFTSAGVHPGLGFLRGQRFGGGHRQRAGHDEQPGQLHLHRPDHGGLHRGGRGRGARGRCSR